MNCKPRVLIGQYRLLEIIGESSLGEIWLATDSLQDEHEVILVTISSSYNYSVLFEHELLALQRLNPEYVFSLLSSGHFENNDYIVFEPVDGCTLRGKINQQAGRLDLETALPIFLDVLSALDHIHSKQIIHLNIKPENIFLPKNGRARIADFSMSLIRPLSDSCENQFEDKDSLIYGALTYMAPEQLEGPSYADSRTDLYSFGVMLFETLTGELPFKARGHANFKLYRTDEEPASLLALRPELPRSLNTIYLRLLANDKELRFQTASDVEKALREVDFSDVVKGSDAGKTEGTITSEPNSDNGNAAVVEDDSNKHPVFDETAEISEWYKFCPSCGIELEMEEAENEICAKCNASWRDKNGTQSVCSYCGKSSPISSAYCPGCQLTKTIIGQPPPVLWVNDENEKDYPDIRICKVCGYKDDVDSDFCAECGHRLKGRQSLQTVVAIPIIASDAVSCSHCGAVNSKDARWCAACSLSLDSLPYTIKKCPACGTENRSDATTCNMCFAVIGEHMDSPAGDNTFDITTIKTEPASPDALQEENEKSAPLSGHAPDWNNLSTGLIFGDLPAIFVTQSVKASPKPLKQSAAPPEVEIPSLYQSKAADWKSEKSVPRVPVMRIGSMLNGRYRVEQHVAQGGFANVYLVVDIRGYLNEAFAVKIPIFNENPDELANRLRSQLKIWKLISDTEPGHVVRLLNVESIKAENTEAVGIFMEYMAGGNLGRMITANWNGYPRNREQLTHLIRLFLQICHSIQSLHSHGFLHRDIKPVNLLLDASETTCKLSDFELIKRIDSCEKNIDEVTGTPVYMAPECFDGCYSVASDIFALGATLYHTLCGELPFKLISDMVVNRESPVDPTSRNPLIPPELSQIVMRCLEPEPLHRPPSVEDLIHDLVGLGLVDEGSNTAPLNLARLMLAHLAEDDLSYLIQSLENSGFRSARAHTEQQRADLIEEYCYTASPYEILAQNCTSRQLAELAKVLGLDQVDPLSRDEMISRILEAVGFLLGPRQVPGIESTLSYLQGQLLELPNATTSDELLGMMHSGLAAIERVISMLVRFYGHLLYGSGIESFLSRNANGKPADRLTFGEKVAALRTLCLKRPTLPLADRVKEAFQWPIISYEIFKQLDELVSYRNRLVHQVESGGFQWSQRFGRKVLSSAVEILTKLAENEYIPRIVQIISRQDDIYGRHFYLGQDDHGHTERIFTPLPLAVGELYLFYPLTNPARINPLIFLFESPKRKDSANATNRSDRKRV